MDGSVAIPRSPVILESVQNRNKLSLTLSNIHQSNAGPCATISRCLFGAPDPQQAKEVVKDFELNNAISFGKRFNFDIVNGEPFPHAKRIKLDPTVINDSDEENQAISSDDDDEGYIWTETFDEDHMITCNKPFINPNTILPNRHLISLFIAPVSVSSRLAPSPSQDDDASLNHEPLSNPSTLPPSPAILLRSSQETNNNIITNKRHKGKGSLSERQEKRYNRLNILRHLHNQTSARKSLSTHNLLHRVKQAVMKKSRKSIITDFLQTRRLKNGVAKSGK